MAFELRKEPTAGVQNPPPSHVAFFADENGSPTLKDSEGVVTPAASTGNPVTFIEQVSAPPATANTIKIYAKEVSGQTEMFVIDGLGNEVQVTIGGSVVGGVPTFNWKGGTPGNPYIAGDVVTADFGQAIVINVEDPDTVTVNFPVITAASAGRTVNIRSLADKKKGNPGAIIFTPDAGDAFENHPVGQATAIVDDSTRTHMCFESDGVGRWNLISFGTPLLLGEYPPP